MMGRLNLDQKQFFYSFSLDDAVPDDVSSENSIRLDSQMSQNHRIIRADVCDPARAVDLRCRHFQVATQAASREPVSSSSA